MAKRSYDENKCLQSIGKVTEIDYASKLIKGNPDVCIGIRRLGKIDYLVNYCGWHFFWDRKAIVGRYNYFDKDTTNKTSFRQIKKEKKEPKLKNKNKH